MQDGGLVAEWAGVSLADKRPTERRADCLPRGKQYASSAENQLYCKSFPSGGLMRRLRCGKRACSPMGRSIASSGDRRFPKGNVGKCVPSGHNRRRRLATRSSGKQQAERTAVRTAPIVCPEESPLVRPQAQDFFPAGGLTRRLRRGSRACSPMGRSHFSFDGERKVCKRKPAARRLQRRPAPLRVIRKYRRSGHCRARLLYLLRPASR